MTTPYKVFHHPSGQNRKKLHVILVRPEQSGNIGAAARALKNMGVQGEFLIVGKPSLINDETRKFAKHAFDLVERAKFCESLESAKALLPAGTPFLASTARVGSSTRPHPQTVREVVPREVEKLKDQRVPGLAFVFGPESDGLSNEEVSLCDSVVTIPSSPEYRSINLSQSVLIFCYEANIVLNQALPENAPLKSGQRQRLIENVLALAEEAGFILPGDPYKMKPRLEEIFSKLPPHIPEVRTLHGLLDQVRRSLRSGAPEIKGRYLFKMKESRSHEFE